MNNWTQKYRKTNAKNWKIGINFQRRLKGEISKGHLQRSLSRGLRTSPIIWPTLWRDFKSSSVLLNSFFEALKFSLTESDQFQNLHYLPNNHNDNKLIIKHISNILNWILVNEHKYLQWSKYFAKNKYLICEKKSATDQPLNSKEGTFIVFRFRFLHCSFHKYNSYISK